MNFISLYFKHQLVKLTSTFIRILIEIGKSYQSRWNLHNLHIVIVQENLQYHAPTFYQNV